jgi:hypothetical protein
LLALATLFGACSTGADEAPGAGRLVTLDDTGNVVTVAPDGTDAVSVADDGGGRVTYFQPIWSPDASSISVTRSDAGGFSVELIDVGTGERTSIPTASNSFYQYWSPDGSALASLSTAAPGDLVLDVFTVGRAGGPVRLADGQPLYFSWSPDSSNIVGHIGNAPLEYLLEDAPSPEFGAPGDFSAPQWTEDGIIHVTISSRRQELTRTRPDGETDPIASVLGGAAFTATRDGRHIAVLTRAGEDAGQPVVAQEAPMLRGGRLAVVDTREGSFVEVESATVVAFSWDPSGRRLLVLEATDTGAFRWRVWEDGASRVFPDFLPAPGFLRDFAPFFDQYAQSMTLWSPGGTAFAYPGSVAGVEGVWRQDLEGSDPVRVAGGTWVAWSSG